MRRLVQEGVLGDILSANHLLDHTQAGQILGGAGRWASSHGSLLLQAFIHDLDLLQWLIGSAPKQVAAFGGRTLFQPQKKPTVSSLPLEAFTMTHISLEGLGSVLTMEESTSRGRNDTS